MEYCKSNGLINASTVFSSSSQSAKEKGYFYLKRYFAVALLVSLSSSSAQISAGSLKSNAAPETLTFVHMRDNNTHSQLDFSMISICQSIIFTTNNKAMLQRHSCCSLLYQMLSFERPFVTNLYSRLKEIRPMLLYAYLLVQCLQLLTVPRFKLPWSCIIGLRNF